MKRRSISIAFALIAVACFADVDAQKPDKSNATDQVALRSAYLNEPFEHGRQVVLTGKLGGKASLMLDPNRCTLNKFGDPGMCTEMAALPIEVELKLLPDKDPRGKGRKLYRIEREHGTAELFLVVPGKPGGGYRLVAVTKDKKRVIPLAKGV